MISLHFHDKPFNITVIQVYAPSTNAKETKVEQFCDGLQDILELTTKKDVLFITGDWNVRVNVHILGISELKWTGMGEFSSDDHYI